MLVIYDGNEKERPSVCVCVCVRVIKATTTRITKIMWMYVSTYPVSEGRGGERAEVNKNFIKKI